MTSDLPELQDIRDGIRGFLRIAYAQSPSLVCFRPCGQMTSRLVGFLAPRWPRCSCSGKRGIDGPECRLRRPRTSLVPRYRCLLWALNPPGTRHSFAHCLPRRRSRSPGAAAGHGDRNERSGIRFERAALLPSRREAGLRTGSWLGSFASAAWSAGWISFRTNRPARLAGQVALAFAALLGLLLFFGDHCDFGTAVHGAIVTFFWPVLMMFTYPAALIWGSCWRSCRCGQAPAGSGHVPPRPDR